MTLCSLVRMSAGLLLSFAWPGLCPSGPCAAQAQVAPTTESNHPLVNNRYSYLTRGKGAIFAALFAGDIETASRRGRRLHHDIVATLGENHPDSVFSSATREDNEALPRLSNSQRQQFVSAYRERRLAFAEISKMMNQPMPDDEQLVSSYRDVLSASHEMQELLAADSSYLSECENMLGSVCLISRDFDGATAFYRLESPFLNQFPHDVPLHFIYRVTLASLLMELSRDEDRQKAELQAAIEFSKKWQTEGQFRFWEERSMTVLAEAHYRAGSHEEADRLYAEVSSRLPEKVTHRVAGWCQSWCDRHDARRLMEKGEWDAAYNKVVLARAGTIDFGVYNLNKGLTMERILRMSAEIQRKRGNHEEAQADQEYADRIAAHAVKLRAALEAERKKLDTEQAADAPAPLPPVGQ